MIENPEFVLGVVSGATVFLGGFLVGWVACGRMYKAFRRGTDTH